MQYGFKDDTCTCIYCMLSRQLIKQTHEHACCRSLVKYCCGGWNYSYFL